ncbi:MAG: hypothetical protein IIB90_17025 [Gemmatimonadetes bacterium]|nr:hypothetical protein [Gemmatimonadota bacterium]
MVKRRVLPLLPTTQVRGRTECAEVDGTHQLLLLGYRAAQLQLFVRFSPCPMAVATEVSVQRRARGSALGRVRL